MENSSLIPLGETASVQVWYDASTRWLYVRWRGNYQEQDAVQGWEFLLRRLQQQPCTQLLNDARYAAHGWAGQEQWVGEALFPQLAAWGVRHVACVYPHDLAGRFSLDTTVTSISAPFVAAFDDLATACSWLQQR